MSKAVTASCSSCYQAEPPYFINTLKQPPPSLPNYNKLFQLTQSQAPLPSSKRPRPSSPAPEASNPPPESLREETPLPSSPILNISSLNQRDALPEQDEFEESDIEVDVDIGVEEPKSQDRAVKEDSTEEPLDGAEEVKKEATEKVAEEEEDYLKVLEGWRREVVTTREWQELKPPEQCGL